MNALPYLEMPTHDLQCEKNALLEKFHDYIARGLSLNMARGKPAPEQLDLSLPMLDILHADADYLSPSGQDCRNYGGVDGLPEMRRFFADMLGVNPLEVIVGGNSSLNLMFDAVATGMFCGFGADPWASLQKVKFLCPCPGYDRHFAVTQFFGIDMVVVPMSESGPDMDMVEHLVQNDPAVKGIWCVPKYANPLGVTYCDDTVRRFAALKPAASDFKIFWDNAYCVHDLTDSPDSLLNLMDECRKNGNEDLPILFTSTSKITFPGAGVAALAASDNTLRNIRRRLSFQTIGPDKLNQLRHLRFLKNMDGVKSIMLRHKALLAPKFQVVLNALQQQLAPVGVARWTCPHGGYFISVDVTPGCAKRVVELCRQAGVTLTEAGATFPYGNDPADSNIRIAPSFPCIHELQLAMDVFCIAAKLAAVEKFLAQK